MTDTSKQDWLAKVRKLLATAESPATPQHLRDTLNAKAADLMAKYAIDEALLAAKQSEGARAGVESIYISIPAPFSYSKCVMLKRMAEVYGMQTICTQKHPWDYDNHDMTMRVFGFAADLTRLQLLFTSLLVQSAYALAAQFVPKFETREQFRASFYSGYTDAIVARLQAAEDRAKGNAGPGTDLVLSNRADEVAKFYHNEYPHAGGFGMRIGSSSGRQAGYAEGNRANLGGPTVGSRGSSPQIR